MTRSRKASGRKSAPVRAQRNRGRTSTSARREADVSLWTEAFFAAELLLLHASPVFYGIGVPRGDGSAVVIIPGFLGTDTYLMEMHAWLARLGYSPYFSGIGINADCPNLLIQRRLNETIEEARAETGRKVHLVGHSLGGVLARSIARQRTKDIASVTTLAAPFRGLVLHKSVLFAAETVRSHILAEHEGGVLPGCYTGRCSCDFIDSLRRNVPKGILQTAIYTRQDGVADWRYCITRDAKCDFEVPGTHIGLAFNPSAYRIIAERISLANQR